MYLYIWWGDAVIQYFTDADPGWSRGAEPSSRPRMFHRAHNSAKHHLPPLVTLRLDKENRYLWLKVYNTIIEQWILDFWGETLVQEAGGRKLISPANMSPVHLSRVACAAVALLAIVRRWLMMLTTHGTLCSPDTILHTPHLGRGEHELQTFVQPSRYSAILQPMNRGNQREWREGDWVFWRTAVLDT